MKKSCKTCELYINKKCCGTKEYYGIDTKDIFPNGCDCYEESFREWQKECKDDNEILDKLVEIFSKEKEGD